MSDEDRGQVDTTAAEIYDSLFVPGSLAGSRRQSLLRPRSTPPITWSTSRAVPGP